MQAHSDRFADAIRHSYTLLTTATHRNMVTGATTRLNIVDGSVTEDCTAAVRRTLTLTIPAEQDTWDLLEAPGEITIQQGIRYTDAQREMLPQGVFVIDQDQIGYGPGDTIQLTCPDRWVKVQRNQFGLSRASIPGNAAWQEIKRLLEACWGGSYPFPGWASRDEAATTKVGSLLWDDGDRAGAILTLCKDNGLEVFFNAAGLAVLRPIPSLSSSSPHVWTVDAGASGVMVEATRTRDRSSMHNAVIVTPAATDVVFAPQEAKNTTVGDPLNVTGPLGYVPFYYQSPTARNSTQALAAGRALLSRQLGVAQRMTLGALANPALEAEDVILAVLPRIDRNTPRPTELHMLDSVTHPLVASEAQEMVTRSTRPDTDGT